MPHPPFALAAQFQQGGRLRAAINIGNPILASQPHAKSMPTGVSVDLANEFARRLGIPIELVRFDSAGKAAQALSAGQVQLAFLAHDPEHAEAIRFSPAYVEIEGSYPVREAMAIARRAGAAASIHLAAFVEEMKRSGFVACALRRHQINGATVAPPADQLQGAMS
jgi:polar amino acid transport system substrate-binding protein